MWSYAQWPLPKAAQKHGVLTGLRFARSSYRSCTICRISLCKMLLIPLCGLFRHKFLLLIPLLLSYRQCSAWSCDTLLSILFPSLIDDSSCWGGKVIIHLNYDVSIAHIYNNFHHPHPSVSLSTNSIRYSFKQLALLNIDTPQWAFSITRHYHSFNNSSIIALEPLHILIKTQLSSWEKFNGSWQQVELGYH